MAFGPRRDRRRSRARHRSNRSGHPASQPSRKTTLFVRTREDCLVPAPGFWGSRPRARYCRPRRRSDDCCGGQFRIRYDRRDSRRACSKTRRGWRGVRRRCTRCRTFSASFSDFAVFTRFVTPRGPLSAEHGSINLPVVIGGRVVTPGDLVIGDDDGLVALSPSAVRSRLMDAKDRQAREAGWIDSLKTGRSALETFGLGARKSL